MFMSELTPPGLDALADAIETGRLKAPFAATEVARYVANASAERVSAVLAELGHAGMEAMSLTAILRVMASERRDSQRLQDRVELVWSGPELVASASRDTSVVVRSLFRDARALVLIANYAFDRPKTEEARARARVLFAPLAENMDARPELRVQMFVNIQRPRPSDPGGDKSDSILLQEFLGGFRDGLWPGRRLPEVFYDPRGLRAWDDRPRASMHAKCLAVDDEWLFVTSANFTTAAQERNIEAGVLLRDAAAAAGLRRQFESLIASGQLIRAISTEST